MSKKIERFVDIEGCEGSYQVSSEGNVKSLNYRRTGKEKLLIPVVKEGYLRVGLCKNGKVKMKQIHRLVAEAFLENPLNLPEVNHKDEDKTNNCVENLEWCGRSYNINYGTRNKRVAEAKKNGKTSKQVYQYTINGELVKIWSSTMECERNGFNHSNVAACCKNKFNRIGNNIYKGYKWSYHKM